jgi:predicted ATPase
MTVATWRQHCKPSGKSATPWRWTKRSTSCHTAGGPDNQYTQYGQGQEGLSRLLSGSELYDGTLRYSLWVAALLTPRPPLLMVLNEPETSLHPDLLPALGRPTMRASQNTQVWVVSHANRHIAALNESPEFHAIELEKNMGQTQVMEQGMLDEVAGHWSEKQYPVDR